MTTSSTTLLGLALPVTGELSNTWGDVVNNSITNLVDSAISGTTTLSSDADVTLTTTTLAANQARQAIILWTAGGTVTRTITAPAQSKPYIVINKTSSSQSIKIVGVGPTTGVTIAAGTAALVAWNGVDFVTISVISTTGVLPVANGGTGLASGTSGGILAYTATGTLASSGLLAANALVLGGGAGVAPATTTTGAGVVTALGIAPGSVGGMVLTGGAFSGTSVTASSLTSGRVTYAGTAGLLQDSANLTFNGTTLTANTIGAFTLGGTVSGGGNNINNVIIGASSPLAGAFTTLSATGNLNVSQAGSDVINPAASTTQIRIGASGFAGLRIGVDNSFNVDTYNSASPINVLKITQAGASTFNYGLAVTGALSATQTFRTTGYSSPASGAGLEIDYGVSADTGRILSYDRTASAAKYLQLAGLTVEFKAGSGLSSVGTFSSTGLNSTAIGATTPSTGAFTTLSASGNVTVTSSEATVRLSTTGQKTYDLISGGGGNLANGYFGIRNNTNSNTPFYIDPAAPANCVYISSTGLAVTGTLSATGNASVITTGAMSLLTLGDGTAGAWSRLNMRGNSTNLAWSMGVQDIVSGAWTLTPSTTNGGNTYTTPVLTVSSTGLVVTGTLSATGAISSSGSSASQLNISSSVTGNVVAQISSTGTSGGAFGLLVNAGTTSADYGFRVRQAGTFTTLFTVAGDGATSVTGTLSSTGNMTCSATTGQLYFSGASYGQVAAVGDLYLDAGASKYVYIRPNGSATAGLFSAAGLAVTGTLSATQTFRTTGYSSPASGAGLEIDYGVSADTARVLSYDRTASAAKYLQLAGLTVELKAGSGLSSIAAFSSTGLALTGDVSMNGASAIKQTLTTGYANISGSTSNVLGANIFCFGDGHATVPEQIQFRNTANTTRMTLDSSGNLLVGTTSAVSGSKLVVASGDATIYGLTVGRGGGAVSTNTAVGASALPSNLTAGDNTAVGYQALYTNTSAGNVAIGAYALFTTTAGSQVAVGSRAAYARTTATGETYASTFIGTQAGSGTTSGIELTYLGGFAGRYHTGSYNTAVGTAALYGASGLSTGTNNTVVGYQSGYSNTTGSSNTLIGLNARYYGTTGTDNVAVGTSAMQGASTTTTGSNNTAVGSNALFSNTTASNNTAVGYQAGYTGTAFASGSITALGYKAAYASTAGRIVAIGENALVGTTTGDANVAVGYAAGYSNISGVLNTYVGDYAAFGATGDGNTAIGARAGYLSLTSGANNVLIGYSAGVGTGTDSQSIVIGYNSTGKGTNTGFINPNTGGVYQGNNSTLWSVTSDQRLKKNIVDNNVGLEKINAIRVRNFEYRLPEEVDAELKPTDAIKKEGVQLGVIAQELQAVLPDCVKTESTGVMSVNSDALMWHMINAIKELSAKVTALENK